MRIADNPKIWGRIPGQEQRPAQANHDYDNYGWCKACGISAFRAHWEGQEECTGTKRNIEQQPSDSLSAMAECAPGQHQWAKPSKENGYTDPCLICGTRQY
jgi:hypothetical protein